MHRFFVDDDPAPGALLRGAQAHQIANVLRLSPGEEIAVVRDGFESIVVLDAVSPSEVRGHVTGRRSLDTELRVALTLALPILRGDRTEEVIEAVTQLGVSRIVPYVSSRSVVRALGPAKRERWARVARESAETARRGRIPTIDDCRDWVALFDALGPGALKERDLLGGRYRLAALSREDPQTQVWRALDESTHQVVTIELLVVREPAGREGFLTAARRMAAIERPSVMKVVAIHDDADAT